MIRRTLLASSLLLLAACGGGGSAPQAPVAAQSLQAVLPPCSVVAYGDSIFRSYYTTPAGVESYLAEPMAAALRRLLPRLTVEDRSIPGQNMRNVSEGFTHPDPKWGYVPAFNLQSRAGHDVVVLESGVIDAWLTDINGAWPVAESVDYDGRLRAVYRQVTQEGKQLVLTGLARQHVFPEGHPQRFITPGMLTQRDGFDNRARVVADSLGIPFADIGAARFDGAPDILDAVHPSQAYSTRMVERIASAVAQACQRAGKAAS